MHDSPLIQIDISDALSSKLGRKARWVPAGLVRWLRRTICQDELNAMLGRYYPRRGAEFCDACIADLGVEVDVRHAERLPAAADRRVIFVSNHPLGGLDGIVLISELSKRYGPGVKVVVNDLLMAVDPLGEVFLPINKHGKQSRQAAEAIGVAMEGDDPVVVFPAGLVSRRRPDGDIKDLDWHKMFVCKARQYKRDVVPLHFSGRNSGFFYDLARWRSRLGLKFNIEMIYLPREVVRSRGKKFTITVGHRVPWTTLADGAAESQARRVKDMAYALKQS